MLNQITLSLLLQTPSQAGIIIECHNHKYCLEPRKQPTTTARGNSKDKYCWLLPHRCHIFCFSNSIATIFKMIKLQS
jgi:hypothetical protein